MAKHGLEQGMLLGHLGVAQKGNSQQETNVFGNVFLNLPDQQELHALTVWVFSSGNARGVMAPEGYDRWTKHQC